MSELFCSELNRCLHCSAPQCARGCPLGNDYSRIISLIKDKQYRLAVEEIGHPFGEICGYVCPHEKTCQGSCVLGRHGFPVMTGFVERKLFAEFPYVIQCKSTALQWKHYAVVGGGVSGLTFACKAYENGANVTVFEQDELLSTIKLIPNFRLPRDAILRAEQAFCGKINLVRDKIDALRLKTLQAQFDGVYVSTGLALDYGLGVDGQALATNYRDCLKGNFARGTVVVVGGGNSAMDCARYAVSLGCRAIIAYRRTKADMPAFQREIVEASNEGVEFMFNFAPVKLEEADGALRLTLAKTVSEGRGKLVVTDDVRSLDCNAVIAAIGSKFDGILSAGKKAESHLQYGNVYLGGDARQGKLVVDAVKDGMETVRLLVERERKICS